jgi:hypothetical protein
VLELSQTRWSSKPSSTLKPQKLDGPVWETGLSSFEVTVSWSLPLSWPMSLFLEHCSTLLWPPLDFFPHRTLLHHWSKIYYLALSSLNYIPSDQQEAHWVTSAPIGYQVLSLPPRKTDGLVWHSRLSNFCAPKLPCPADG